jgi:uncharacterized protein (TIGR00369 family)
MALERLDDGYAARIDDMFARQNFMVAIGARLALIELGRVEIELPFREDLTQQHGYFHGGVTSAIADNAGGCAAYTLFPSGSGILTVEFKINLLAPAKGEKLVAVGAVIKPGRTLTITDLKVFGVSEGARTLCASGQQTLMCLVDRSDL